MTAQADAGAMRPSAICLLPILFLALAGCTPTGGTPYDSPFASEDTSGQVSDGFPAPSKGSVWEVAMQAVREQGYVPDPDQSRMQIGVVSTRWRLSLQPFGGQGYRERVTVRVEDVPKRKGFFRLETNVIRQMNDNLTEPSNPLAADWVEGKRVAEMEALLNQRIELYFLPSDVSPEFRKKYGMPAVDDPRIGGGGARR
jgi:hypothetical protein